MKNHKTLAIIPVLAILIISVTIPIILAEEGDLPTNVLELQNKIYNFQLELTNAKLLATTQAQSIIGLSEKLELRSNQVGIQNERIKELEIQNAKYFDYMDELREQIINNTHTMDGKDFWDAHAKIEMDKHFLELEISKLKEKIDRLTKEYEPDDLQFRHDKFVDRHSFDQDIISALDICDQTIGVYLPHINTTKLYVEMRDGTVSFPSCLN